MADQNHPLLHDLDRPLNWAGLLSEFFVEKDEKISHLIQ